MVWLKIKHLAGKTLNYNALPSYLNLAATSHTGTENKSAMGTSNGPLAGPSAASPLRDIHHLPLWGWQRP